MNVIRVTKIFNFEIAHALYNYDGLCRNIHGHSYKMYVTVSGTPLKSNNNPKDGMVIDFSEFKSIIKKHIVDKFDHSLFLNKNEDSDNLINQQMFKRLFIFDFQPTCENMIIHFAEIIKTVLPHNLKLLSVRLHETDNNYAEWYSSDQIY
ncbi:MAG TPA: 6-carboxytetrahydropterin synthase [Bacteroidales bacterium]|jgi:6-pyruvoyltetrahydropterin/6-carboxytetrahydropterin synthase|nr:6-carboxytetrahydropterin synthase [Bacteroidales bacterium]MDD4235304.1 6-carboxytetrahydropterin synthase [Bacteroidales bacterium]MDY0160751.1 6-carboxytetrahydropterin synthase [Bacteroidales bacterium]HRW20509.1 6-carboxytetrahydropterin synthase [Bacteroidales bacterium]HXK80861.1 6-carboxytetrahydropterin synthase [Bacteroidales bacterium]